jgi:hypothetical protein
MSHEKSFQMNETDQVCRPVEASQVLARPILKLCIITLCVAHSSNKPENNPPSVLRRTCKGLRVRVRRSVMSKSSPKAVLRGSTMPNILIQFYAWFVKVSQRMSISLHPLSIWMTLAWVLSKLYQHAVGDAQSVWEKSWILIVDILGKFNDATATWTGFLIAFLRLQATTSSQLLRWEQERWHFSSHSVCLRCSPSWTFSCDPKTSESTKSSSTPTSRRITASSLE